MATSSGVGVAISSWVNWGSAIGSALIQLGMRIRQFNVRGLLKVKAIALWHALAFNFTRFLNLEFKLT